MLVPCQLCDRLPKREVHISRHGAGIVPPQDPPNSADHSSVATPQDRAEHCLSELVQLALHDPPGYLGVGRRIHPVEKLEDAGARANVVP
jgi:hypothetical protein